MNYCDDCCEPPAICHCSKCITCLRHHYFKSPERSSDPSCTNNKCILKSGGQRSESEQKNERCSKRRPNKLGILVDLFFTFGCSSLWSSMSPVLKVNWSEDLTLWLRFRDEWRRISYWWGVNQLIFRDSTARREFFRRNKIDLFYFLG